MEYMQRSRSPYGSMAQTITRYESRDYEVLGIVMAAGIHDASWALSLKAKKGRPCSGTRPGGFTATG
jgi:hypothetical protein